MKAPPCSLTVAGYMGLLKGMRKRGHLVYSTDVMIIQRADDGAC